MKKLASVVIANMAALVAGCSVAIPSLEHDAAETQARPASMARCGITGDARVIAAKTRARSGVEAVSLNHRLAVGYAVDPTHAVAVDLDPGSLVFAGRMEQRSVTPVARVTPVESADRGVGIAIGICRGRGWRAPGVVGEPDQRNPRALVDWSTTDRLIARHVARTGRWLRCRISTRRSHSSRRAPC